MFSYEEINEEWSDYCLKKLRKLKLPYYYISANPNITWKTIQTRSDKPWNYIKLSGNPNITWEIIQSNPDKPWNYCNLSLNPNITFEMIQHNLLKSWDKYYLGLNKFTLEKEMFFRKKLCEWFKKSDLKRELIAKLWHPKNYEKFKYYDPEMFSDGEEEQEQEE